MTQIAELERRIADALERVAKGAKAINAQRPPAPTSTPAPTPQPVDESEELAQLRALLAAERTKSAQLSEQVSSVRQRQESSVTQMERCVARLTEQLDLQSLEMLRLKKANAKLMEANAALREAQITGTPESAVLNRSLSAELEALQAERRAEMAEMEEILAEIRPLLNEEPRHV